MLKRPSRAWLLDVCVIPRPEKLSITKDAILDAMNIRPERAANFAEAVAEGRGKAQAESLRKTRLLRPDLMTEDALTREDRKLLAELDREDAAAQG